MGERFRLKASYDITPFPPDVQVILRAMKRYGIMLADNGSSWYISGAPDPRWDDDNLHMLGQLLGSNFEAVDATVLRIDPNSGAAIQNGVSVAVSPSATAVRVTRTRAFTATVTGASNSVTWRVNDVLGGNASVGFIGANGQYTAPSAMPSPPVVTVRATSTAVPTASATASVTVLPFPTITAVTPSSVPVGNFTLTVDGAGFLSGSVVSFDNVALPTSFVSSTRLTASGTVSAPKSSVPVTASTPDGETSNTVLVNVVAAQPVSISISPTSASVRVKQTRAFTAAVQNTSNKAVIWKVNGIVGGNSTVGTISTSGSYRAPNAVPNPARVTVSATSAADQTKTATASVTIVKR
jgi:hypothetical protein